MMWKVSLGPDSGARVLKTGIPIQRGIPILRRKGTLIGTKFGRGQPSHEESTKLESRLKEIRWSREGATSCERGMEMGPWQF